MKSRLTSCLSAWLNCRRGNVAIIFGFSLVPLIVAAGGAVDLTQALTQRAALMHQLDNGALAAAKLAMAQKLAGDPNWKDKGNHAGAFFMSPSSRITQYTYNGAVIYNVGRREMSSNLWFTAFVPTSFLQIIGVPSIRIHGEAHATFALPRYMDLHIVVDNSGSMGIGATDADIGKNRNTILCSFACHFVRREDQLQMVRDAQSTLRIDVVKKALKSALQAAQGTVGTQDPDLVRVALYTMSNSLTPVLALESDFTRILSAIDGLDLTSEINQGGTNITHTLSQLDASLARAGSGITKDSRKGVVILVTDGVQDSVIETVAEGKDPPDVDPNFVSFAPQSVGLESEIQGLDPVACQPLKNKGYLVMTLEAKYVIPGVREDVWTNDQGLTIFGTPYVYDKRYAFIKDALAPDIEKNLRACASSTSYYRQANEPDDFTQGIGDLISQAMLVNLQLTR